MANFRGENLRGRGSYSGQVNVSTSSVNPQEDQRNVSISRGNYQSTSSSFNQSGGNPNFINQRGARGGRGQSVFDGSGSFQTGRGGVAFDRSGSGSHQYGRGGGNGRGTSTPSFPNRGGLGNGNTVHPVGTYNGGSYVRNVIPTESHTSGVKQEELKQEEAVPERSSTDVAASLPKITQDTLNKLADVSAKFLDAFSDLNAIFQQLRR
uniref:Uncharacterized protein n=1 Tax=Ditylenchus dipsaci TaxID=166011 RepID=A0A915D5I8_9BILA